jgi:hypothetical protein
MKPIIFNTPMVQAILAGRKTQTRRVIKDKDITNNFDIDVDGSAYAYINPETGDSYPPTAIAKYQVGDILWVRETWSKDENGEYVYRTNYGTTEDDSFPPSMFKWKPSIHMPREAARIFLRVTNVRVERLQDISEDEAIKEGAKAYGPNNCSGTSARIAFAEIWDKTTTEHEWRTNPWVWVYEFEKISKEEAERLEGSEWRGHKK